MNRSGSASGSAPAFLRPAILEAILFVTCASVAIFTILAGERMRCTALVEFGMLSAIAAASAAALFARYAVEVCGIVADYRFFEFWGLRANALGYVLLGLYATANGLLDIAIPRRDADWISYPGLATAAAATLVTLVVLQSKFRILEYLPSRSLLESLSDDGVYLALGGLTLMALVGHILAPAWWLDTMLDGVFIALVATKMQKLRRRSLLLE
jgi:hypothetical protein